MEILPTTGASSKDFWSKKQSIVGYVFIAALLGFGLYSWGVIVPWIITMLQNTLTAIALGLVTFGVIMMIMNPRIRATVAFLFQHFCTWITSFVTDVYPLEIIRNYIKQLNKSCEEIREAMRKLAGAIAALTKTINDNNKQIEEELGLAQAAKNMSNLPQMTLHANQAQYLMDSNKEYQPILKDQKTLYDTLKKVYDAAIFKVTDKTNQTNQLEIRWKTSKASSSAVASAKKIFKGSMEADMAAEAMSKMENTIANEVGSFNDFMQDIHSTLETIDVKNGMMTEKGLALLDKINNNTDFTTLLNKDGNLNTPEKIYIPAQQPVRVSNTHDDGLNGLI